MKLSKVSNEKTEIRTDESEEVKESEVNISLLF
jgi:hypothetical protein